MNPLVKIPEYNQKLPKLYSRQEAKDIEGIYAKYKNGEISSTTRFISNGQGEIFIFGDPCLLYKTSFNNLTEKNLVKLAETITFTPID